MRARGLLAGPALLVALAAGCAEPAPPPGGPVDETPPRLLAAEPGSLATGVDPAAPLVLRFSEKVERRGLAAKVGVVPMVQLERPGFDGLEVRLRARGGWPADSVVVWTLKPTLTDRQGVALGEPLRGAFTTADSFPAGGITAELVVRRLPLPPGAAAPKPAPLRAMLLPAHEEGGPRPRAWREVDAGPAGALRIPWLEPGSGPWRLVAWADRNGDLRPGDGEEQAAADSLFVPVAPPILALGTLELVDEAKPVPVYLCLQPAPAPPDSGRLVVLAASLDDDELSAGPAALDSNGCATLQLRPGAWEAAVLHDLDGDGRLSAAGDSLSERFGASVALAPRPATPDSAALAPPELRVPVAQLDSLEALPLPLRAVEAGGPGGP